MKTCPKCLTNKPFTEFSKDAARRDGLQNRCKVCNNAKTAVYRATFPDRVKSAKSAWAATNSDKRKAYLAAYYAANREKCKETSVAYRAANLEACRATEVAWKKANPEAIRISNHNTRAKKRSNGGQLSKGLADKLFKLQKGKCPCCNKPLGKNFHRDHIMPVSLGGAN